MISNDYKKQLEQMADRHRFKEKSLNYDVMYDYVNNLKPSSIIDFGCAHGRLIELLKTDFPDITAIDGYDPGVKEFEKFPKRSYECLISNDVIEHIEPEYLDHTLHLMNNLFTKSARIIIACYPAKKILPDGRNAHLTIKNPDWWDRKIEETFLGSTVVVREVIERAPEKYELHLILSKTNG